MNRATADTIPEEDARRPGRPRSTTADSAILDAAFSLFAEQGFDGLTVDGVAARAGVGKATIYRRYPCKADLVIASLAQLVEQKAPHPDTGTVRGDLEAIGYGLLRVLNDTEAGRATPMLIADAARNADLERARREFVAARRRSCKAAVRRGIARGELRDDTDADLVADLVSAPIFYRLLVSGDRIDKSLVDAAVDVILRAFGTSS